MVVQSIAPSQVRFTQDSISEVFSDPTETIESTFKKLLYGDITINSIRNIGVVRKDGKLWVVSGNRRLYIFRKLQEYGRISEININIIPINQERFDKMFTTKTDGQTIYIRQDRQHGRGGKLEDRLRVIYNQWVKHGRPKDGYPSTDFHDFANYFGGMDLADEVQLPRTSYARTSIPSAQSETRYVTPTPRVSYQERPITVQPQTVPRPPAPKKDDSRCTIL